ncbi:VOC family protein [Anaerococcus sp. ENR1011]|uniref:VOC family protein n=1 Tax=Anaerococcus groningensis TaxID=3115616 RepID=A0ABW9MYQ6_9FIRM
MIDHISLQVSDIEKAKDFYEKVLSEIGLIKKDDYKDAVGFGKEDSNFANELWLVEGNPNNFHLAFRVDSEEEVINFYNKALELGAKDNGAPGIREHYAPNYYAAFFHDLDGNNIEAVFYK